MAEWSGGVVTDLVGEAELRNNLYNTALLPTLSSFRGAEFLKTVHIVHNLLSPYPHARAGRATDLFAGAELLDTVHKVHNVLSPSLLLAGMVGQVGPPTWLQARNSSTPYTQSIMYSPLASMAGR